MDQSKTFLETIQSADVPAKLNLLARLAHNLTVVFRGQLMEAYADLDAIRGINEMQHQITARLSNLLNASDEWDEKEFVETLYEIANEGGCNNDLRFAIKITLNSTWFIN